MRSIPLFRGLVATFLAAIPCLVAIAILARPARAEGAERRIALVIGNAAYPGAPLATTANDAGLVAQTLQAAGFDVVGARDLDEAALRQTLRDFTDKAAAAGPDAVTFIYLAGYGLQAGGENYFAPVDARIESAADVAVAAVRISDYAKRLAALPLKARFLVLDAGRRSPFASRGEPLAGGLALMEAEPGSLVAFNAAPGTVGPAETGAYGAYAQALAEMIRDGGLDPAALFDRVRLRTAETSAGALVPWDADRIEPGFRFLQRAAEAPPLGQPAEVAALRARPLREVGAQEAFALCLERDTPEGYADFLAAYPGDSQAARVRAILAARREAVTWRRSWIAGTPDAYWSYLRRYPRGPHAFEARRRLASLSVPLQPPPRFVEIPYDLPPPPADEIVYVERPVVYFADPVYALPPPPPPPVLILAGRPAYILDLPPPPPPAGAYLLPSPAYAALPAYVHAPAFVAPPPDNPLFGHRQEGGPDAGRPGPTHAVGGAVAGAALGAAAIRVALPPSVARRAGLPTSTPSAGMPSGPGPGAGAPPVAAHALPTPAPPLRGTDPGAPVQAIRPGPASSLPPTARGPAPGSVRPAFRGGPNAPDPRLGGSVPGAFEAARGAAIQRAQAAAEHQRGELERRQRVQAFGAERAQAAQRQQAAQRDQAMRAQQMQLQAAARAQQVQAARAQQMQRAAQHQPMQAMPRAQTAPRAQAAPQPQGRPAPQGGHPGHCPPGIACR